MKKALDWSQLLANVFAVVFSTTAVFAVVQYYSDQSDRRARYVFDLLVQFNQGEILEARNRLIEMWSKLSPTDMKIGFSQSVANSYISASIDADDQMGRKDSVRLAIMNITSFFDGVKWCYERDICEKKFVEEHFSEFALDFKCLYGPSLDDLVSDLKLRSFGEGLSFVAALRGKCAN